MRDRILCFNYMQQCGGEWMKVNFINFHETQKNSKTHSSHVTFMKPRVPAAGESNVM